MMNFEWVQIPAPRAIVWVEGPGRADPHSETGRADPVGMSGWDGTGRTQRTIVRTGSIRYL